MAMPITQTPKLSVKESEKFMKKISKDINKPAILIPTPKLVKAKKVLKAYALKEKK